MEQALEADVIDSAGREVDAALRVPLVPLVGRDKSSGKRSLPEYSIPPKVIYALGKLDKNATDCDDYYERVEEEEVMPANIDSTVRKLKLSLTLEKKLYGADKLEELIHKRLKEMEAIHLEVNLLRKSHENPISLKLPI